MASDPYSPKVEFLDGPIYTPTQVTASGSVQIVPSPPDGIRRLVLQCDPASSEQVKIGASGSVTSSAGLVLEIGASIEFDAGPAAVKKYYVWSSGSTGLLNVMMRG